MYQLQVRVVSGNNLPVGDLNGFSDPYVKLFWGGQTVKTSTKKKTLNPYWNETFTLTSSLATEPLKVSCYDWDRFTRDDVLGTGEVRTDDLINKTEKAVTVHLSPRGELQLRLTALNFPEHYGNTAGTTYTTTSYVPMGGGGTVDDMLKQRFSMGYNSGAAPYMSSPAPYGSVGLGAPQGPPSYYPPPQSQTPPASYYPPPQSQAPPASYYPTPQQPTYPTSYMPTGGGAPSSYLPGGYGTGAPPPAGGYGGPPGGYGAPPTGGYGGPPGGGYGGPPPAGGGYGGPPGGGYGTGGAPYGAPPPGGGYPPQQYPPSGY